MSGIRSAQAIVMPVVDIDDRKRTALSKRQKEWRVTSKNVIEDDIVVWDEENGRRERREAAYEKLGLRTVFPTESVALGPGLRGARRNLDSLGGDTVWVRDDDDLERLAEALGSEFSLSIDPNHSPADRTMAFAQSLDPAGEPKLADRPGPWGEYFEQSGVTDAHADSKHPKGKGVVCAVLDSGVDADHATFKSHRNQKAIDFGFVRSGDWKQPPYEVRGFDLHGHGTHISSIIAGDCGVAPGAKLIAAGTGETRAASSMVMFGIGLDWLLSRLEKAQATDRRLILNLSLGFPNPSDADAPDHSTYGSALRTFNSILDAVLELDTLVVASVGNTPGRCFCPANRPDVLSVGACDSEEMITTFSGHLTDANGIVIAPDVLGFGEDVPGARLRPHTGESLWVVRSGTSQAAAYVTGLAALYWSQKPTMSSYDVRQLVDSTAMTYRGAGASRTHKGLARFDGSLVL